MVRAKFAGRSALEWFQEAERWYVIGHQGCPLCHGQHCVIRSDWSGLVEYYCSVCDFSACHDGSRGEFFAAIGTPPEPSRVPLPGLIRAAEDCLESLRSSASG
jgi:hypothetical protein